MQRAQVRRFKSVRLLNIDSFTAWKILVLFWAACDRDVLLWRGNEIRWEYLTAVNRCLVLGLIVDLCFIDRDGFGILRMPAFKILLTFWNRCLQATKLEISILIRANGSWHFYRLILSFFRVLDERVQLFLLHIHLFNQSLLFSKQFLVPVPHLILLVDYLCMFFLDLGQLLFCLHLDTVDHVALLGGLDRVNVFFGSWGVHLIVLSDHD